MWGLPLTLPYPENQLGGAEGGLRTAGGRGPWLGCCEALLQDHDLLMMAAFGATKWVDKGTLDTSGEPG